MSEFKEWRLASGYAYDKRQEQVWQAAARTERERCAERIDVLAVQQAQQARKYRGSLRHMHAHAHSILLREAAAIREQDTGGA